MKATHPPGAFLSVALRLGDPLVQDAHRAPDSGEVRCHVILGLSGRSTTSFVVTEEEADRLAATFEEAARRIRAFHDTAGGAR